jgi:hypothetical protein
VGKFRGKLFLNFFWDRGYFSKHCVLTGNHLLTNLNTVKMKKLLVVLAIGAIVACNNSGDTDATKDTATIQVDTSAKPVDTTAKPVDTTAKPVDTSAAKK